MLTLTAVHAESVLPAPTKLAGEPCVRHLFYLLLMIFGTDSLSSCSFCIHHNVTCPRQVSVLSLTVTCVMACPHKSATILLPPCHDMQVVDWLTWFQLLHNVLYQNQTRLCLLAAVFAVNHVLQACSLRAAVWWPAVPPRQGEGCAIH
jgi:hypothetical protein